MISYLSSPQTQLQAHAAAGCPVLGSFAVWRNSPAMWDYAPSFSRLLIDSGAYSELVSGNTIDGCEYVDFVQRFPWADAAAGIDDIRGDWRRSLSNYEKFGGFPTFHDTDPDELLDDLIQLARERGGWIGIGILPPRTKREGWLARTLERIPNDLHVHGFALFKYAHIVGIDSVDSTAWFRVAMRIRKQLPWLTYAECLDISVKNIKRRGRFPVTHSEPQESLFGGSGVLAK